MTTRAIDCCTTLRWAKWRARSYCWLTTPPLEPAILTCVLSVALLCFVRFLLPIFQVRECPAFRERERVCVCCFNSPHSLQWETPAMWAAGWMNRSGARCLELLATAPGGAGFELTVHGSPQFCVYLIAFCCGLVVSPSSHWPQRTCPGLQLCTPRLSLATVRRCG